MIKTMRDFPSVEELLQMRELSDTIAQVPRPVASETVKTVVSDLKQQLKKSEKPITKKKLISTIKTAIDNLKRQEITRVINATGIVVHTNLGRAPLSETLIDAIKQTVTGYGNIEFDLARGTRGKRGLACERYLALLAGAEAATVVNNCAAALFIVLNTLANRKEVIISRGELVQIGGGFRIPDILRKSGAKLCEVGTTNITTIDDYVSYIKPQTGLLLKVHKSNFVQGGFTEEVALKELVKLGNNHHLPVVNDPGSGVFIDMRELLGYSEPTVQQSVRTGAVLTTFSGDKLLGGVQAGLIVGKKEYIQKIKRNALFRTMRVDKIVFSMLEHLFGIYLNGNYKEEIKLWSILSIPESELYKRAKKILSEIGNPPGLSVEATNAFVGGGALPESAIPSVGIVFSKEYKPTTTMTAFRKLSPPVIGRIENDHFILDMKAIDIEDIPLLASAIKNVIE